MYPVPQPSVEVLKKGGHRVPDVGGLLIGAKHHDQACSWRTAPAVGRCACVQASVGRQSPAGRHSRCIEAKHRNLLHCCAQRSQSWPPQQSSGMRKQPGEGHSSSSLLSSARQNQNILQNCRQGQVHTLGSGVGGLGLGPHQGSPLPCRCTLSTSLLS